MQTSILSKKIIIFSLLVTAVFAFLPRTTEKLEADTCYNDQSCSYYYGQPFNTPTPSSPNTYPSSSSSGNRQALSGSFTLTSNNSYCMGQIPRYTVRAPAAWAGQTIRWTSMWRDQITLENSYVLGPDGTWSESGNMWDAGTLGPWTKKAEINGVTQTITFTVSDCGSRVANTATNEGSSQNTYPSNSYSQTPQPYTPPANYNNISGPYYNAGPAYTDSNGYYCQPPTYRNDTPAPSYNNSTNSYNYPIQYWH